jgi:hypothetical protein
MLRKKLGVSYVSRAQYINTFKLDTLDVAGRGGREGEIAATVISN